MVTKFWKIKLIACILALVIAGCTSVSQTESPTPEVSPSPTESPEPSPTATSTLIPTPSNTPLPKSEGPTLLLQTDFNTYQIIDFDLGTTYSFYPPGEDQEYTLASNISPDRTQMIFINPATSIRIADLATGTVRASFEIGTDSFQPENAVEAARIALPDLGYSDDMLNNAIKTAYLESLQSVTWFQDSDHLLAVLPGSDTNTLLSLIDLKTGEDTVLESEEGFVQTVYPSPGGDLLLVKKSLVFDANAWQDDRYFLIDLNGNSVTPIPLPEDADNPSLGWWDQDYLRLIHKVEVSGSEGLSLLNVQTMESTTPYEGLFSNVWAFDDNVAIFTRGLGEENSTIELISLQGDTLAAQDLSGGCTRTFVVGENILVNCETESLILDKDFSVQSFGGPIALIKSSSLGVVIITRSYEAFLFGHTLENYQSLELTGEPLEVLWLPDQSGFLYRTYGTVYLYDFLTRSSRLILESDLFTDYRNLNAVWIDLN